MEWIWMLGIIEVAIGAAVGMEDAEEGREGGGSKIRRFGLARRDIGKGWCRLGR